MAKRKIPDFPSQPPVARARPEPLVYEVQVVTPMVGGGAEAGDIDTEFPVQGKSIRGHLRHWWRVAKGFSLGEKMWRREEEIFGSTEFPSPVSVELNLIKKPKLIDPKDSSIVDRFGPVAYALFPSIENEHLIAQEGFVFQLKINMPSDSELKSYRRVQNERRKNRKQPLLPDLIQPIKDEIIAAVNSWLNFGGVGGRTRRGCGSLCEINRQPDVSTWPGRIFLGKVQNNAIAAWQESLKIYREFRQTPRGKIHPKVIQTRDGSKTIKVPGRSHWPEADSIRLITGCSLKPPAGSAPSGAPADEDTHDHSIPVVPKGLLPAFPKAMLGLPINFHFADGPNKRNAAANLDPKDVQLYPVIPNSQGKMEKAERMASPIITRPVFINGKWYPAVIVLKCDFPKGFQLRVEGARAALNGDLSRDFPQDVVNGKQLATLETMRGKQSAIDAFISYLVSNNFQEIPQ